MRIAMVVCLVTSALPHTAGAELGRLFYAPTERAELDATRSAAGPVNPRAVSVSLASAAAAVPTPSRPSITLDGYVLRSGRLAGLWINGADFSRRDLARLGIDREAVEVGAHGLILPDAAGAGALSLKPGQFFEPLRGSVGMHRNRLDQ